MTKDDLKYEVIRLSARIEAAIELYDAAQAEGLKPSRAANGLQVVLDDAQEACDRLMGSISRLEE